MANITYPYNADLETLTLFKHETVTITVTITDAEGVVVDMDALSPDEVEFQIRAIPGDETVLIDKYLTAGVTLTETGVEIALAPNDLSALTQRTYWADLVIQIEDALYVAAKPFPVHVREIVGFPQHGV